MIPIFERETQPLAELADIQHKPITVEGVSISNPNNIDKWISSATKESGDKKARIYQESLVFADSLSADYRIDFLSGLYRAIREEYLSFGSFLKETINLLPFEKIDQFMLFLKKEIERGILEQSFVEEVAISQKKTDKEKKGDNGLSEEAIKRIANQALLRERLIDRVDESRAIVEMSESGQMSANFGASAQDEVEDLLKQYKEDFQESFPEGNLMMVNLRELPLEIGKKFDAHGIAKSKIFKSLIHLLENGVDQDKSFHTMELTYNPEAFAIGAVSPYTDGGIIVVGPVNKKDEQNRKYIVDREKGETNIKYVILDRHYYFAVPELEKVFPDVRFVKSGNMIEFFTNEVAKADSYS